MAALITPPRCTRTFDSRPIETADSIESASCSTSSSSTVPTSPAAAAMTFEAVLTDGTTELVPGASAYTQEGHMTTFFRTAENDPVIDAWSERVASIRTAEIRLIRRSESS